MPKIARKSILIKSFFSTRSDFIKKESVQKSKQAPVIRKKTNARGPMKFGIKFLAIE